MLDECKAHHGATALIVEVVDAVASRTGYPISSLLSAGLAKAVSSYRLRENGTRRQTVTKEKLRELVAALADHLDANDIGILWQAFALEQEGKIPTAKSRGVLLFGLSQASARKHLRGKLAPNRIRSMGLSRAVRDALQREAVGTFRSEPREALPVGNDRRPIPGELFARSLLALAAEHLDDFSEIETLEHAQICSEAAMVVGWLARHAEDTEVLSVALQQAVKANSVAPNQQLRMNVIVIECYLSDLRRINVNPYQRFIDAMMLPRVGLPPLDNVVRSVAARCAKALILSCTDPFSEVVHDGMTATAWLFALRRKAEEIHAYDSVIVVDRAIIDAAVERFHRTADLSFKTRFVDTAMKAWADMTYRMQDSRRYRTPATKKDRDFCHEKLRPLVAWENAGHRIA